MFQFFDYVQLASLILFVAMVVGRTIRVRRRQRINPIRLSVKSNGVHRLITFLIFVGMNLWVFVMLLHTFGGTMRVLPAALSRPLLGGLGIRMIGLGLVVLGFVIFIVSMIHLGDSWRLGIDEQTPGELVTWGIYALSRNPIYVFFDLYFFGVFLLNGTPVLLIFAVLGAISLHLQVIQEERFLGRIYGQTYERYRTQTARYVTWQALARAVMAARTLRWLTRYCSVIYKTNVE